MTKAALALTLTLLGCAHAPAPGARAPAARPALALTVGEASYPDLDESYQVPQVAEPACLAPRLDDDALPASAGLVLLRFAVAADGTVDDESVLANSAAAGPAALGALQGAVRGCRWIPARDPQGRRVRVYVQLPFVFQEAAPERAAPGA